MFNTGAHCRLKNWFIFGIIWPPLSSLFKGKLENWREWESRKNKIGLIKCIQYIHTVIQTLDIQSKNLQILSTFHNVVYIKLQKEKKYFVDVMAKLLNNFRKEKKYFVDVMAKIDQNLSYLQVQRCWTLIKRLKNNGPLVGSQCSWPSFEPAAQDGCRSVGGQLWNVYKLIGLLDNWL